MRPSSCANCADLVPTSVPTSQLSGARAVSTVPTFRAKRTRIRQRAVLLSSCTHTGHPGLNGWNSAMVARVSAVPTSPPRLEQVGTGHFEEAACEVRGSSTAWFIAGHSVRDFALVIGSVLWFSVPKWVL